MTNRRSQFVAMFLAAAVAVEGTLAGVAHRHCHSLPAPSDVAATLDNTTPRDKSPCSARHNGSHGDRRQSPGQPGSHDERQCLACQFLAKNALPAIQPLALRQAMPLAFFTWPSTTSDPCSQLALPLSRGPPVLL